MKSMKNTEKLLLICLIGSLLMPGLAGAGNHNTADRYFGKNISHVNPKIDQRVTKTRTIPKIRRKPDLATVKIQAVRWQRGLCYLRITVKNTGAVPLPQDIYNYPDPGVNITINGHPGGSMKLKMFDPGKKLRKPGSAVTKRWGFSTERLLSVGRKYTVKADIFTYPIEEENFHNNVLVQQVSCK